MSTIKIVRYFSRELRSCLIVFLGALISISAFAADQIKLLDFTGVGLYAKLDFKEEPKLNEESVFNIGFGESSEDVTKGEFIDPNYDVEVNLWMPNCRGGHPSAPVTLKEISHGVYEVSKAYFIMAGTWDIVVTLRNNTKLVDVATLRVTIKQPSP